MFPLGTFSNIHLWDTVHKEKSVMIFIITLQYEGLINGLILDIDRTRAELSAYSKSGIPLLWPHKRGCGENTAMALSQ